jgi:hypothetical protein
MRLAMERIEQLTGERPSTGWYTGRDSPNTRRLVVDYGGFEYDSDYYGDDLPFWMKVRRPTAQVPHLVVPYTLDTNDMRFSLPQGFSQADDFFQYLRDSSTRCMPRATKAPKMMSVGMHCRLLGRPGRIVALQKFLDHIEKHDRVWVCRRIDIARHWKQIHPLPGLNPMPIHARTNSTPPPPTRPRNLLDGLYEHSPWIAQAALAQRPFRSLAHLKHAMATSCASRRRPQLACCAPTRSWPARPW